jgi:Ni,Fe-hydrogenase III large subunit
MSEEASLTVQEATAGHVADRNGIVRIDVDCAEWSALARGCSEGHQDLCSLWVEEPKVRMALLSGATPPVAIATLQCQDRSYPSVGQYHAPAIRLERAMRDLYGVIPEGLPDERPWLDHGVWPDSQSPRAATDYRFLPVEGEGLHQIPVGPVHAGIIEPGHFRFTANGETVVRLEERLGYVHKGVEKLCVGKTIEEVAKIMGRVAGDSTVAYAFAFARAVEVATGTEVSPRAVILRGVMAEIERIAHHINDFGAICNDASAVAIHAHCTWLREQILQACHRAFGHRLMMDRIVPGGVASDIDADAIADLRQLLGICETRFRHAVRAYDSSPSIQDRTVTTGRIGEDLTKRFAAGGFVGRAAGRNFDSRRDIAYPPYDSLWFEIPVRSEGDVNARAWVRIDEVTQSLSMIRELLDRLEPGPVRAELGRHVAGEGAAFAEAFRGDLFVALRLDPGGCVTHCHVRDASWFQWPLLEAAIEGNIVADFPLCNKSFNCSYSGHDI